MAASPYKRAAGASASWHSQNPVLFALLYMLIGGGMSASSSLVLIGRRGGAPARARCACETRILPHPPTRTPNNTHSLHRHHGHRARARHPRRHERRAAGSGAATSSGHRHRHHRAGGAGRRAGWGDAAAGGGGGGQGGGRAAAGGQADLHQHVLQGLCLCCCCCCVCVLCCGRTASDAQNTTTPKKSHTTKHT